MEVKTYRGKSPEECFQKVKKELGLDAVILESRSLNTAFGKFGAARHEVVAAIDVTIPADKSPTGVEVRRPLTLSSGRPEMVLPPPRRDPAEDEQRFEKLEKQLTQLTANMSALAQITRNNTTRGRASVIGDDSNLSLIKQLQEAEVAEPLIKRLVAELPVGLSEADAACEMRSLIVKNLKTTGRMDLGTGTTKLIAFFGGTGTGKTTTIAKIAAQLALREKRKIAIVTMDTHRVAASQQLQTYGEILRVPVRVAYNKQELKQHLAEFASEKFEAVLLDTAGRLANDSMQLADMIAALGDIEHVYTFLMVTATLSSKHFESAIERFHSQWPVDALIMTKLDETIDSTCFGHLLNVQVKTGIPLTYITNGQRVPDDMVLADAHAIAGRLLTSAAL